MGGLNKLWCLRRTGLDSELGEDIMLDATRELPPVGPAVTTAGLSSSQIYWSSVDQKIQN